MPRRGGKKLKTRIGPSLHSIRYQSCVGCKYHLSRIVRTGRNPQYSHDCDHPDVSERYAGIAGTARYIGTTDQTPNWCPVTNGGGNSA